jgi:hypothetical protein
VAVALILRRRGRARSRFFDAGPDGLNSTTTGNTLAFIEGIFIP